MATVILPGEKEHVHEKNILPDDLNYIKNKYIDCGLYRAMTSDSEFAKSLLSSEWLYKLNDIANGLEKTGIVYGYFKSIEQLLITLIRPYKDKRRFTTVVSQDGNEEEYEYTSNNERRTEGSLWSINKFIESNSDILDVSDLAKRHIRDEIDNWREIYRNGYAHIENLTKPNKVTEIRMKAIYLYFLILGSFVIRENHFEILGIHNNDCQAEKVICNELMYQKFEKWIDPIFKYGWPENAVTLCLHIHHHKGNCYSFRLTATSRFDENDKSSFFDDFVISPSTTTNLFLLQSSFTNENAHDLAEYCIVQYMIGGTFSDILKSYQAVVIINFARSKYIDIVYKKNKTL
jgi:hypothetical protein